MSDEEVEWDPFSYVEEDRDVLEHLGAERKQAEDKSFPAYLLTSDPVWAREIVQRSRAEKVKENARDDTVPAPEIPARLATGDEWPRAAKTLLKKLDGWVVSGWYMRGPQISGRRVLGIRTAFALRADHETDGRHLRVVFHQSDDAKWSRKADWLFDPAHHVTWRLAESVKSLEAYAAQPEQQIAAPIPLEGW